MGTSSLLHIPWPSTYLWLQNTDSPHIQASYLQRILICHCEHKGRLFFRFQSGKGTDGCSSLALTGSRHIQGRAHLSLFLEPLEHSDLHLVWAKTRMQTSRVLRPGGGEFLHCVINARAPRIFRTSSRLFTLDLPKMHLVTLGSGTELDQSPKGHGGCLKKVMVSPMQVGSGGYLPLWQGVHTAQRTWEALLMGRPAYQCPGDMGYCYPSVIYFYTFNDNTFYKDGQCGYNILH